MSKYKFAAPQMEYLGYIISTQEVATGSIKVSAVVQWPVPRNAKDVQTFLGITGYYARFVHSYAGLAAPLGEQLNKECTWQWIEREQLAFEGLKIALTMAPVLVYPDYTHPFLFTTAASNISVGAVL